jgi:hypothetical protein
MVALRPVAIAMQTTWDAQPVLKKSRLRGGIAATVSTNE